MSIHRKTSKGSIKAAILLYSLVQTGTICISSILTNISDIFSQYNVTTIQFLATCPSIVIVMISLLSGKIAEYISKKYLALFSSAMFMIAAFGGFFFHDSLIILFIWQIILGIGIGILVPIGTSLIADYFEGEERSSLMGIQSAVISGGGVILSLLGGFLATVEWYYNYLSFLLIIPGFLLIIWGLPLDRPIHSMNNAEKRKKVTLNIIILYGSISFAFMLLFNAIPTNLAMHLKEQNITGSVNAGIASSILMLSGAIAGLLFKTLTSRIGEKTFILSFINLSVGSCIIALASSFEIVLVGIFIAGFSLSLIMAQIVLSVAEKEKQAAVTMCIAIIMAVNNLGAFLSPYFTKVSNVVMGDSKVASRYLLIGVLSLILAILLSTIIPTKNQRRA